MEFVLIFSLFPINSINVKKIRPIMGIVQRLSRPITSFAQQRHFPPSLNELTFFFDRIEKQITNELKQGQLYSWSREEKITTHTKSTTLSRRLLQATGRTRSDASVSDDLVGSQRKISENCGIYFRHKNYHRSFPSLECYNAAWLSWLVCAQPREEYKAKCWRTALCLVIEKINCDINYYTRTACDGSKVTSANWVVLPDIFTLYNKEPE